MSEETGPHIKTVWQRLYEEKNNPLEAETESIWSPWSE